MHDLENSGSVDYVVVEFPRQHVTGELAPALMDLVDRRIIHVMDVMWVAKAEDGSFEALRIDDVDPELIGGLATLAGASSGLLGEEDAAELAGIMTPGTGALLLVYENLWSLPFAVAAREAGGQLISTGHIPIQGIVAALDALEA